MLVRARLLLHVAASAICALGGACSSSSDTGDGPAVPVAIQPQPIPEAGFVGSFVASAFVTKETAAGLEVSGRAETLGPSGVEPAAAVQVAAFDASAGGAILSATTTTSGAFTFTLPRAAGHDVFVFFEADAGGPSSALLAARAASAPVVTAPCITVAGARGLDLGSLPALAPRPLPLDLDNACGGDVAVASVRVVGAPMVSATPAPFSAASGRTTRVSLEIRPPSKGPHLTFVVFDDGARRHVLALRAKGS